MDATASKIQTTQALVIVGGAAMLVGSLLPWATASHVFGQTSFAGTDGDGVFTLIIGAAVALIAWLRFDHTTLRAVAFLGCMFAGFIGLNVVVNLSSSADSESVLASVGAGLYIMLLGALVAAVAIVAQMRAE